ncbi:MAG: GlxA family transcriptional regulator [Pseudomonadota bacterium]
MSQSEHYQVTIIGFDKALATAITGIMDLFRMAGVTWARIHDEQPEPRFSVTLATADGGPCHCVNGVSLLAGSRWDTAPAADLVVIPTIGGDIEATLDANQALLPLLQRWHHEGRDLASNCTGAFLLGEAGLLEGREATTHWGYSGLFRQRYPEVDLRPHRLITSDGIVFCAGGGMAWFDLGLFLVERYCGVDTARALARAFVMDMGRESQAAYGSIHARRYHQDEAIITIQDWLDEHLAEPVRMDDLAAHFHMTPRTFKRRFRNATGDTPLRYLQQLRVEKAKKLLEQPHRRLSEITQAVGYEDTSAFSRLFHARTGMTPGAYRSRFLPSASSSSTG